MQRVHKGRKENKKSKMICIIDIETEGLDATKFVMGCLLKESGKYIIFHDKKELWNHVLELGRKEQKRKKQLTVYSHNANYDFSGYANLMDKNIRYYSIRPFIAEYAENNRVMVKFLDSMGIFKMSLKKLGKIIGLEKIETPKELIEGGKIENKEQIEKYVKRDCEIVMKAIKRIKDKIKSEGIKINKIYTSSQIAIAYFIKFIKEREEYKELFYNQERGIIYGTRNKKKVHGAYRGGRVECFKLGEFENVYNIDVNNLYGYSSMNIKFPNIKTETLIGNPLRIFEKEKLLKNIGISRCLVINKDNKIGLLPIRTNNGNYYPKENRYLIGTWTNMELEKAEKEGYEIIDIEWTICYKEMKNPFKELTPELYKLRKSGNEFDDWFYKEMQNRCYGKLAQNRNNYEIIIDDIESAEEYKNNGYEIVKDMGYNYAYEKKKKGKIKKYYAPIIPTLINAYARIYMYDNFKKINEDDLLYTDTDNCMMRGNHIKDFKIGNNIGEFKIVNMNENVKIYGKKTYSIGSEIKISGFRKTDIDIKDFKKGKITNKKMITIRTGEIKDVGKFYDEERDLNEQLEKQKENEIKLGEQKIYKDDDIENINYFTEKLGNIT